MNSHDRNKGAKGDLLLDARQVEKAQPGKGNKWKRREEERWDGSCFLHHVLLNRVENWSAKGLTVRVTFNHSGVKVQ